MHLTSPRKVLDRPAHVESRFDDGRARFRSEKAGAMIESVIREMSRVAKKHHAVNLAQGFPDFPAPDILKNAACEAINRDINQYPITWGAKPLRDAIAAKYARH